MKIFHLLLLMGLAVIQKSLSETCIPSDVTKVWIEAKAPLSGWYHRKDVTNFQKVFENATGDGKDFTVTMNQVCDTTSVASVLKLTVDNLHHFLNTKFNYNYTRECSCSEILVEGVGGKYSGTYELVRLARNQDGVSWRKKEKKEEEFKDPLSEICKNNYFTEECKEYYAEKFSFKMQKNFNLGTNKKMSLGRNRKKMRKDTEKLNADLDIHRPYRKFKQDRYELADNSLKRFNDPKKVKKMVKAALVSHFKTHSNNHKAKRKLPKTKEMETDEPHLSNDINEGQGNYDEFVVEELKKIAGKALTEEEIRSILAAQSQGIVIKQDSTVDNWVLDHEGELVAISDTSALCPYDMQRESIWWWTATQQHIPINSSEGIPANSSEGISVNSSKGIPVNSSELFEANETEEQKLEYDINGVKYLGKQVTITCLD